jgi:thymidylate kinase
VTTPFFVLEGRDAAGKSTVASLLEASGDFVSVESPAPPLRDVKTDVLNLLPPLPRLLYFVAANLDMALRVVESAHLDRGMHVIVARYIWSTIAYHAAIEDVPVATAVEPIRPILSRIPRPDRVVFLEVDRFEQIRRLASREEDDFQQRLNLSDDFQARLAAAYEASFALVQAPIITIDTTGQTLEETLDVTRSALEIPLDRTAR